MGDVRSTYETECKGVSVENHKGNHLKDLQAGERITVFKSTLKEYYAKLKSRFILFKIQTAMNFWFSIN
jgi:hypothetical protein